MRCGKIASILVSLVLALCLAGGMCLAQQKPATPAPAPPAAAKDQQPAAGQIGGKTTPEQAKEFAACSPAFPGEQISEMMEFAVSLSPELPAKLKPVLMKCDFEVNNRILAFIEDAQEELASLPADDPEAQKMLTQTKAKEMETELILAVKPVNEKELQRVVGDLFEIRNNAMKARLKDLEEETKEIKARLDERKQMKDQIVGKKMKELTSDEPPQQAMSGAPGSKPEAAPKPDKLSWD
jgi:hypothetical protein